MGLLSPERGASTVGTVRRLGSGRRTGCSTAVERSRVEPGPSPAAGLADPRSLLCLQSSVGNAAVTAMLSAPRLNVQKEGEAAPGQSLVDKAKDAIAGKRDRKQFAWYLVWTLIHESLPDEGRKLSGTGYDAKLTVAPDFGKEPEKLPIIMVGDKLIELVAADKVPEAVLEIRMAFEKVDDMRVKHRLVDAADLKKDSLVAKLKQLSEEDKERLILATKDDAVRAFVKNIGISTPLPTSSTRESDGSSTTTINGIKVLILPDSFGGSENETEVTPKRDPEEIPFAWTTKSKGGTIESFTPDPVAPKLTVEIHTTYKAGNAPSDLSGYGLGTTLGQHEGSHGTDYLAFVSDNPYPVFKGKVGDTEAAFKTAIVSWNKATKKWHKDIGEDSLTKTDCGGTKTIDDFHKGEAGYKNVCK